MTAEEFIPHLDAFIKAQKEISGYWNGEDDQYVGPDGDIYTEDDAHTAQERMEAAQTLRKEIMQYDV